MPYNPTASPSDAIRRPSTGHPDTRAGQLRSTIAGHAETALILVISAIIVVPVVATFNVVGAAVINALATLI